MHKKGRTAFAWYLLAYMLVHGVLPELSPLLNYFNMQRQQRPALQASQANAPTCTH